MIERGKESIPMITLAPVVVKPDTVSKKALAKLISKLVDKDKGIVAATLKPTQNKTAIK